MDCHDPSQGIFPIQGLKLYLLSLLILYDQHHLGSPRIEPGSPALQAVSLSSKPPGKPHNTWAVPYIPVTYLFIFLVCTKTFIYIFLMEVQFDFIVLFLILKEMGEFFKNVKRSSRIQNS